MKKQQRGRTQTKEKQHATRYGGLPCYYDKPYISEWPRLRQDRDRTITERSRSEAMDQKDGRVHASKEMKSSPSQEAVKAAAFADEYGLHGERLATAIQSAIDKSRAAQPKEEPWPEGVSVCGNCNGKGWVEL